LGLSSLAGTGEQKLVERCAGGALVLLAPLLK
jgi:hypothetical protein